MSKVISTENLKLEEVLKLYNSGIGVAGIAKRLGVGRTAMCSYFRRNNIKMRNAKEQQVERMKFSTPEQIAHLVEAAHKASKGKTRSLEIKKKIALSKYKSGVVKSEYEKLFMNILNCEKIQFEYQFPINIYNVDFIINGVIVEIFGGGWHRNGYHKKSFPVRTKCLLNEGYPIIFVFTNNIKKFENTIKRYIIPNINTMGVSNNWRGRYKIIWDDGRFITQGDENTLENALIFPFHNNRNTKNGRFESILKEKILNY